MPMGNLKGLCTTCGESRPAMGSSYEAYIKNEKYGEERVGYCDCNRGTNKAPFKPLATCQKIGLHMNILSAG